MDRGRKDRDLTIGLKPTYKELKHSLKNHISKIFQRIGNVYSIFEDGGRKCIYSLH